MLKRLGYTLLLAVWAFSSCTKKVGPLMEGTADLDSETDFAVNYLPDGSILTAQVQDIEVGEDGKFALDFDMASPWGDYELLVGDKVYGVYLEKGKTVVLDVKKQDNGYAIEFTGDNADLCNFATCFYNAFDLMVYSDMDGNKGISNEQYRAMLDENHAKVKEALEQIEDKEKKEYFAQKTEAMYHSLVLLLLEDKAYELGEDAKEYPEYKEIIQTIDPNSDLAVSTNLLMKWLFAQVDGQSAFKGDLSGCCMEMMDVADQHITNPKVKKLLCYYIPNYFFSYGDHVTGKDAFWERYKGFAKDYPEYIKGYEEEYNKEIVDMSGKKMPDIELLSADGKKVMLSTLLNGKLTYIDVWATWCGPCCKEIPFLEKLVEKMKGNDKVQFISISVDSDQEAWHKKIENDRPVWAQYIVDGKNNKELSKALNIQGIPRFFILDADGVVVEPEAMRPSDEQLPAHLEELIR